MTGRNGWKKPATETLHQRILTDIEGHIVSGEWPPGHRIPFEIDLAKSYDVSRMTVNKVLTQLASAGLIERRKKSGSFVAQPRTQSAILEIHDIEDEVRSLGKAYSFRVEQVLQRSAREVEAPALDVGSRQKVLYVVCIHYAGAQPFCLEERVINLKTVPQAGTMDFATISPGKWLLEQVPWTAAEHRISAAAANDRLAHLLELGRDFPCLVVERRTWDAAGPVTSVRLSYPADRHSVVATFAPASA